MSHGDDPYDYLRAVTAFPGFPAPATSEFVITPAQLDQLFPPGQTYDECERTVGIRVADVAIQYGADVLLDKYCEDLASGATHATGKVFELMGWFYPLQTLENMGLWTTLDAKVTALNYCAVQQ